MQIELTSEETSELARVVRERMGELSEEIHHADVSTVQDELKKRKALLQSILNKLG